MPGKRKITIETLTELGAHKLAELLIAEAAGNTQLKQAIDLALSSKEGPTALGAAVRNQLAGFAKSHSMPSYERGREIIVELDGLRTMIVENIGAENPRLAFELLWELIELHPSILELVDDSSGRVGDLFTTACYDLGPLAERASINPDELAALVLQKITNNHYGIYDGLIKNLDVALGQHGRAKLQGLLLQWRQQYLTNDKVAANAAGRHDFTLGGLSLALRDIAEIDGDTDAFIDTYQDRDLTNPHFASEIALQLLRAGRAEEALSYLDRAQPLERNRHFGQLKWTDARIAALEALKRTDEAQALRLAFFQVHLSLPHLREYLRRLPDFEDFEAEQRALDHVVGDANVHAALSFLVEWPAHERAAQLVLSRNKEIDGDRYELLDPAASLIEGKYPLAAVLLRRALIEVTLRKARATRYKHAARHVREIDSLNTQIRDYENFETHDQFMERLRKTHPRKTGFWPLLRD
jgi:tetratricopeptide (TPR) repeat protein